MSSDLCLTSQHSTGYINDALRLKIGQQFSPYVLISESDVGLAGAPCRTVGAPVNASGMLS
jgi:hypothetical protein